MSTGVSIPPPASRAAIACSAHAFMIAPTRPERIDDYVATGRAMQRLWLTVEKLGLQSQPEMTPLIFNQYARAGQRFTQNGDALARADNLAHH